MNRDRYTSLDTIDLSSESSYDSKKNCFLKRLFFKYCLCIYIN